MDTAPENEAEKKPDAAERPAPRRSRAFFYLLSILATLIIIAFITALYRFALNLLRRGVGIKA